MKKLAGISIIFILLISMVPLNAFALSNGQAADRVLGQSLFTTANSPSPPNSASLNSPSRGTISPAGDLWVADNANSRVLKYDCPCSIGQPAALVLGQTNFGTGTANTGGITASSLSSPQDVAVDMNGRVWVADTGNNRVLRYNNPTINGQAADIVLGQALFTTVTAPSPPTASTLNFPRGVTVDSVGNVWVADSNNNRLLKYNLPSPAAPTGDAADLVLGQPNLTSGTANNGGRSATSLATPTDVAVEADGDVWVADFTNQRVLKYNNPTTNGQAANLVLGQALFTSGTINEGGLSAASLSSPSGILVEADGDVWVADTNNNRVLKYNNPTTNFEAADLVLGQALFTTATPGTTITTLFTPSGVALESTGSVWAIDTNNHRILRYAAITAASQTQGQASILGTCGLSFVSGAPINYGSLAPGSTSTEQTLVLDNTGSNDAALFVRGGDWVDVSATTIMTVDKTKFSTVAATPYASKTSLLTTDQSLGTITSATNLNTYWQLLAELLSPSFTGSVTQTMDFTATC